MCSARSMHSNLSSPMEMCLTTNYLLVWVFSLKTANVSENKQTWYAFYFVVSAGKKWTKSRTLFLCLESFLPYKSQEDEGSSQNNTEVDLTGTNSLLLSCEAYGNLNTL